MSNTNINLIKRLEGILYFFLGVFILSLTMGLITGSTITNSLKLFVAALTGPVKIMAQFNILSIIYSFVAVLLMLAHPILQKRWALILTFLGVISWLYIGMMANTY